MNYGAAIENGLSTIEVAGEFQKVFPDAIHNISYFKGALAYGYGQPTWTSKIGLHGRYVLTLQFAVEFDLLRRNPARTSEPEFRLAEINQIDRLPDGRLRIRYSSHQVTFGEDEWDRFVQSEGNSSIIEGELVTTSPLPLFDEAWPSS